MKFFSVIFVLIVPNFLTAASFNCAKASSKNEIAICSDPELSNLDEILAATYKETRSNVSDTKKLKGEQINWIKSVGTCDGNVDCLLGAYRNRILVLDYLDGQVTVLIDPLQDRVAQLDEREEILDQTERAFTTELRALNSKIERLEEEILAHTKANNANVVDPLQDRISQLNEREEILAQRERAFMAELRALNEDIQRFEDEKSAHARKKDTSENKQSSNAQTPEGDTQVQTIQKTQMILPSYQSEYFIYEPCDQPPTSLMEDQLQGAFSIMIDAISEYNAQPNVDMIMEYPVKAACLTSVGKPGTMLEGVVTVNFYVDYDHFACSVITENCQGQRMGYQAGINFISNKLQVVANTYRFEDAVFNCIINGVKSKGRC